MWLYSEINEVKIESDNITILETMKKILQIQNLKQ